MLLAARARLADYLRGRMSRQVAMRSPWHAIWPSVRYTAKVGTLESSPQKENSTKRPCQSALAAVCTNLCAMSLYRKHWGTVAVCAVSICGCADLPRAH